MTPYPWPDALIILGLVVLNALFSMTELAIVSARPARLKVAAEGGSTGAKLALELAADPGKLLSTAQIGITLIGIIAGAYSGASLGGPTGERLAALGVPAEWAETAGFMLVIAATTYLSLVIGELVPKQLGLRLAEPIAIIAARPMQLMAQATAPLVWLLNSSSVLILRLFGMHRQQEQDVTAEELHMIFAEATRSGVIEEDERALMTGIMRLAERPVREVMTPRTELHWIERRAPEADLRAAIADSPHSLLLVADGSVDNVVGVVKVRDVLSVLLRGRKVMLSRLMKKPAIVPDQLDTMDALRVIQQAEVAIALVHDEYGHLEGIVTPADLLDAIVGNFVAHGDEGDAPMIVERGRLAAALRRAPRRRTGRPPVDRAARRPRLRHCGRLCTIRAEAPAERGRALPRSGLALRSRRHGRPQDRQAPREQGQADARRSDARRLKFLSIFAKHKWGGGSPKG